MPHLIRTAEPALHQPVLIAAFEGWNDAGEAATFAARFLAERWEAEPFATIDPEEFFDFTSTRPHVRLDDDLQREIVWPSTTLSSTTIPDSSVDVIFVIGSEPQLKWRTFCDAIVEAATAFDPRLVVTLGALLAEVPHSRPVNVVGTAYDRELVRRLSLTQSTYQGPTGIVGVLHDAFRRAGVPSASFWAAVPTYVPSAPSPKAALALVQRIGELLTVPLSTTDLEIASASYERQIDELVADDEDTAEYVARLELAADEPSTDDDEEDGDLIAEVERFLREQ
jgi:predicted ATP-grasp superfamily ATP-dependent carboligase